MTTFSYNKKWYKSKTIIGGIVAAVGSVFGLVITPDVVNSGADAYNGVSAGGIDFTDIVTLAGALVAIWGRITATTKIATTTTP